MAQRCLTGGEEERLVVVGAVVDPLGAQEGGQAVAEGPAVIGGGERTKHGAEEAVEDPARGEVQRQHLQPVGEQRELGGRLLQEVAAQVPVAIGIGQEAGRIGVFAGIAALLAAIGLYGVLSFSVARRRRDIAVQMALGARGASVLRHFMAGGLRLTLGGLALGLALSWAGWRIVSSQLYVGAPLEPQATLAVAALFVLVAATACFFPARRATKVDPMEALRYE